MISNWTEPFGLNGLYKNISALEGLARQTREQAEEHRSAGIGIWRNQMNGVPLATWRLVHWIKAKLGQEKLGPDHILVRIALSRVTRGPRPSPWPYFSTAIIPDLRYRRLFLVTRPNICVNYFLDISSHLICHHTRALGQLNVSTLDSERVAF